MPTKVTGVHVFDVMVRRLGNAPVDVAEEGLGICIESTGPGPRRSSTRAGVILRDTARVRG